MTVIAIPRILRERLTDEGTAALVEILDKVEERSQKVTLEIADERFERRLAQIETKIETVRADLKTEIAGVRADLKTEIAGVRADLKTEIADTRANLIKWMFIFWVGQVGTITAILFAFFKK